MAFLMIWEGYEGEDEGFPTYREAIAVTATGQPFPYDWSTGVRTNRSVQVGDRFFLLHQHDKHGLIGSGRVSGPVVRYETRPHLRADVEFDVVLDADDRLRTEILEERVPAVRWRGIRASAQETVEPPDLDGLEQVWADHLRDLEVQSHDEIVGEVMYAEGVMRRLLTNRPERSRQARAQCLAEHGTSCAVCGIDFKTFYGPAGEGVVQVHHKRPLAAAGDDYMVNPRKDMVPVCPNCHVMLHLNRDPAHPREIGELKAMIEAAKAG